MSIRRAYAIAAGITWFGLGFGLILSAFNVYPPVDVPPGLFGVNPDGLAGLAGRVVDYMSAFTDLSNIIVAIVFTMLARNPDRGGRVWHAVRMDSLVMISITGLIYAIVLAPNAQVEGLEVIGNTLKHMIVPVMTVALWLIVGPRRQVTFASVFTAIVIPITWAAYTLIRGHFIEKYPYDFVNVVAYGLPAVLMNIAGVAALGIVLGLVFWAIDRLLSGRGSTSNSATPVTNES